MHVRKCQQDIRMEVWFDKTYIKWDFFVQDLCMSIATLHACTSPSERDAPGWFIQLPNTMISLAMTGVSNTRSGCLISWDSNVLRALDHGTSDFLPFYLFIDLFVHQSTKHDVIASDHVQSMFGHWTWHWIVSRTDDAFFGVVKDEIGIFVCGHKDSSDGATIDRDDDNFLYKEIWAYPSWKWSQCTHCWCTNARETCRTVRASFWMRSRLQTKMSDRKVDGLIKESWTKRDGRGSW